MAKYVVRSGDTFSAIAARFGVTLTALVSANSQITDPNHIFAGQVVTIPGSFPAPGPAYVVQTGDTLTAIAARFGVTLAALEAANPQITDPNHIFAGQVVTIPGSFPAPGPAYVVQTGDTLTAIAARFGVTLAALEAANPQITDPNHIFAGQVVTIPGSFPAPGPAYVVQTGDTLTAIATRFGVTLAALEAANPQITDPNRIFPGQIITCGGPKSALYVMRPARYSWSSRPSRSCRRTAFVSGSVVSRLGEWSEGSGLSEGAVWPVIVVVAFELVQHRCGMPLVDDQEAVEEFAADRPDEALGDRVRPRCPHRRLDDPHIDGGEDGVEGGGELAVSVSDEEPEAAVGVIEVHQQVAGELGEPGSGGVGGDAEDVYPAGGVLDDEERVEPVQGDRVEVEQVAAEDCLGLRSEELRPGRSGPPRCRVDSGGVQDVPDGGGADLVAEVGELAVDPPVPPRRILSGQAHDQGAQASGDGRSTGPDGLGGPAAGDQLAVPAQDGGRGDEQSEASAGRGAVG